MPIFSSLLRLGRGKKKVDESLTSRCGIPSFEGQLTGAGTSVFVMVLGLSDEKADRN